ncbi:unnamed protein product, partial [Polarella glacialis]
MLRQRSESRSKAEARCHGFGEEMHAADGGGGTGTSGDCSLTQFLPLRADNRPQLLLSRSQGVETPRLGNSPCSDNSRPGEAVAGAGAPPPRSFLTAEMMAAEAHDADAGSGPQSPRRQSPAAQRVKDSPKSPGPRSPKVKDLMSNCSSPVLVAVSPPPASPERVSLDYAAVGAASTGDEPSDPATEAFFIGTPPVHSPRGGLARNRGGGSVVSILLPARPLVASSQARWLPPGPPTRVLQVRQVLPATVSQMASPVGPAFVSVPTAAKPPAATKEPVQIWPPVQAAEHPVEPEEAAEAPPMRSRFGGQQESDMLELMAQGPSSCDELTSQVPLISLGCNCGPKLSFQKIGRGSETLPFDWMQSSLDGILNFLRTDFGGFFDYVTKQKVPGCQAMVMYRGHLHSFWHDDPDDPTMQEKYRRRIKRLFGMGQLALPGGPPGHLLF